MRTRAADPRGQQSTGAGDLGEGGLRIEQLTVTLKGTRIPVVMDVSLEVRPGEVVGLVGESGSGKTTVAHAALGHTRRGLQISSGHVYLGDVDLFAMSRSELQGIRGARVSYVPQDPASALNPALTVGFQLRETLIQHARHLHAELDASERLREVLVETRLDTHRDVLSAYPHQLSGGQQQRAAIAMAFVCRPRLIVLDEPTTGLDVTTQRRILDTVRSLCRTYNVGALYVTHDLAVVNEIADRVAVMYAGEVMELAAARPIFSNPRHPYTRALLRAVPTVAGNTSLEGIEGKPPRPGRRPSGCLFAPRCPLVGPDCRVQKIPLIALDDERRFVRCIHHGAVAPPAVRDQRRVSDVSERGERGDVLSVAGVSARYGLSEVLRDVDLGVAREECLALVGESGSGKTTLARCIAGLHSDWSGEITFEGRVLPRSARARPREALRKIQYVFQNPYTSLNPRKTVEQVVAQPLDYLQDRPSRKERRLKVDQALDDVSLSSEFLHRFPDQLSGGERQRVAVARALVVAPTVLVCDEVTSALDVSVQAIVVELLKRLQRERELALIFITHNLSLVRSIAQRVAVLENGQIVEAGPTAEILREPQHPYTIRLVQDVPKVETMVERAAG